MKEITQYQCETCGTVYNNADACVECEEFHCLVDHVTRFEYHGKNIGPESKYPHAIVVQMENGNELVFKR